MTAPRPPAHPAIVQAQQAYHSDLVQEVAAGVASEPVVVVGVRWLGPDRRARKLLDAAGIPYRYLRYGSYLSGWRRRLALKIWVGWPTFPLIFVRGAFIGGGSDLKRLHATGALSGLVASPGAAAASSAA